ncbi:MAG: hypothetical protein E6Q33_07580 [Neisseriales bacterium]|nr:MAG: hypothetical protein E6Q33_07580 [Neisseriales bacterium]
MIPVRVIWLNKLPMTINGKLDIKALPAIDDNVDYYQPPQNELQYGLCRAFAEVLNLDPHRIGINDDFFRLGGDSILAIQLISRLRQNMSLQISVKEIFVNKTVAKLASLCESAKQKEDKVIISESGVLSGRCKLLPIQNWFFTNVQNGYFADPGYWNQSFTIKVTKLEPNLLDCALYKLVEYHDALRFTYSMANDGSYLQEYQHYSRDMVKADYLNRTNLSELEYQEILTSRQKNYNLFGDLPLFSISYVEGFADASYRLVFSIHHLLIATIGWRIIADDLKILYEKLHQLQEERNLSIDELYQTDTEELLGAKGTSYRQWVDAINAYSSLHDKESLYWQSFLPGIKTYNRQLLSFCNDEQINRLHFEFELSLDTTTQLLTKSRQIFNLGVSDLLLASLAIALEKLTGLAHQYITVEGHGKEDIATNIDISRTIGWFTSMYPMSIDTSESDISIILSRLKETIPNIPNNGVGFGAIFGYDADNLPKIAFNYLGQFDKAGVSKEWSIIAEVSGQQSSQNNISPNLLDINCFIIDGLLHFDISSTIEEGKLNKLIADFKNSLDTLANQSVGQSLLNHYQINEFVSDFNDVYTIFNETRPNNIFILPPGEGGYESYLATLVPLVTTSKLILFNNYYNHLKTKIDLTEASNIDFSFLAKFYIQYIKEIQPHGTYNLFGWSFGGVLAFEIARQLEALGDKVSFLGLVDSFFNYKEVALNLGITNQIKNDINYQYTPDYFFHNNSNCPVVFFKAEHQLDLENSLADKDKEKQLVFSYYLTSHANLIENYMLTDNLRVINLAANHYNWIKNTVAVTQVASILDELGR